MFVVCRLIPNSPVPNIKYNSYKSKIGDTILYSPGDFSRAESDQSDCLMCRIECKIHTFKTQQLCQQQKCGHFCNREYLLFTCS